MKHARRRVLRVPRIKFACATGLATVVCVLLGGCVSQDKASNCLGSVAPHAWNEPVGPFQITDGLFYVGTSGISAYLVTTSKGLILLNCGTEQTAWQVLGNIRQLGFDAREVKILVGLHGHYDHIGGATLIKHNTDAKFFISTADRKLAESGGRNDSQFGDRYTYQPVTVDRPLRNGDKIRLGGVELTVHATPGHTPGAITCTMKTGSAAKPLHVVFTGSVSCPDYTLVGNRRYPGIVEDFSHTFETLEALPCDIFLTEHGWDCGLTEKAQRLKQNSTTNPFLDPEGYHRHLDRARARFLDLLRKQTSVKDSTRENSPDIGGRRDVPGQRALLFGMWALVPATLDSL